jgi:signal transduction histidine kinase/ActR/RegA family two-component response regulator
MTGSGGSSNVGKRALGVDALATATLQWFRDYAAQGIFTTDTDLRVRTWNRWLVAATGLAEDEVLDRQLFEIFPTFVDRGFDQFYAEALSGQVKVLSHTLHRYIVPAPLRGDDRPGHMPQSGRIAPLVGESGIVGTITVIEDVSERVASERELRARIASSEMARANAETASRVKDEFLATLSHEIRTPLNAVLGWTRILKSRDMDPATIRRAVEVIDRNASAQLTLISDMLDMARIAAGKLRMEVGPLDLAAVAVSAIDVIRPAADAKGVRLVTDLSPHVPPVSGDADRLLQVTWNLLSNAVKFTEAGGSITVGLRAEGGKVQLTIADTGQGIDPEFLPHVFERFKQADPSAARRHGGLGLGLALVRELVELHGGIVRATSKGRGHGSTFTVQLPARVEVECDMPVSARPRPAANLEGMRVLVVEDEADAREIVMRSVADSGAAVTAVASAAEALAWLRQQSDANLPHVVVADIGMPGCDGFTFLRELRKLPAESGGNVPAIAVTAYVTTEDRRKAMQAGFEAHVAKPFAPVTLVAAIARVVGSRT